MKNRFVTITGLLLFIMTAQMAFAQNFKRLSLTAAVTGGGTRANYSTIDNTGSDIVPANGENMCGVIDPLVVELSAGRFGFGFTAGGDSYKVNTTKFYGYNSHDGSKLTAFASYFTFDFNYHPYYTPKADLALFGSIGTYKVYMADDTRGNMINIAGASDGSGNATSTMNYYFAKGYTWRTGVKARYYFWKRLGGMVMVTTFAGRANPKNVNNYSFGNNHSTILMGVATEFGLCYRIF